MDIDHLAPGEPLSPELVLVLPAELRAEAIARLGPPAWPAPRPRALHQPPARPAPPLRLADAPAAARPPLVRSVGAALGARVVQLALIFVGVTVVTLTMSLVAHAFR
jgi:hypothetical protein